MCEIHVWLCVRPLCFRTKKITDVNQVYTDYSQKNLDYTAKLHNAHLSTTCQNI